MYGPHQDALPLSLYVSLCIFLTVENTICALLSPMLRVLHAPQPTAARHESKFANAFGGLAEIDIVIL